MSVCVHRELNSSPTARSRMSERLDREVGRRRLKDTWINQTNDDECKVNFKFKSAGRLAVYWLVNIQRFSAPLCNLRSTTTGILLHIQLPRKAWPRTNAAYVLRCGHYVSDFTSVQKLKLDVQTHALTTEPLHPKQITEVAIRWPDNPFMSFDLSSLACRMTTVIHSAVGW